MQHHNITNIQLTLTPFIRPWG